MYFWIKKVTIVEMVRTNVTAMPMPIAVSIFFDTPRKGQMPRNCDRTMLLTKTAAMKMMMYSIRAEGYFFSLLTMAIR